jgi:hypothetical protein
MLINRKGSIPRLCSSFFLLVNSATRTVYGTNWLVKVTFLAQVVYKGSFFNDSHKV